MDLIDQLRELALRIAKIKDSVHTEEATKNAMIMPFIQILGYNVFDPRRIVIRDAKTYCAILFDDNNRKPISRLRFNNTSKMQLGLFNEKEEKIISLSDLADIYKYADQLKITASTYFQAEQKNDVGKNE